MEPVKKFNAKKISFGLPSRITLSGEVASGKSSVGKELARILGYDFRSIGQKSRITANRLNLNILDFQKLCKVDTSIDIKIDQEFANECNVLDNIVIDYRLGYRFIPNGFHIFLEVSETEATKRIILSERKDETPLTIMERNQIVVEQFKAAYGEIYTSNVNYDLVLLSEGFKAPLETAIFISNLIK